jgi:hypothetical protein
VGLDWVLLKPGLEYLLEFLFSIVNTDHWHSECCFMKFVANAV